MNHGNPVCAAGARIGLHRGFQFPLRVHHLAIRWHVGEGSREVLHMRSGLFGQALHVAGMALIPGLQCTHLRRGRVRGHGLPAITHKADRLAHTFGGGVELLSLRAQAGLNGLPRLLAGPAAAGLDQPSDIPRARRDFTGRHRRTKPAGCEIGWHHVPGRHHPPGSDSARGAEAEAKRFGRLRFLVVIGGGSGIQPHLELPRPRIGHRGVCTRHCHLGSETCTRPHRHHVQGAGLYLFGARCCGIASSLDLPAALPHDLRLNS